MAIPTSRLIFTEPSRDARRLLWHVLSIGSVTRDEPDHYEGFDKAGLFLFQVAAGTGHLETQGNRYPIEKGDVCWLLDLRHSRTYFNPLGEKTRTIGVRFNGPGVESWLELLGPDPVFAIPRILLRLRLERLRRLVQHHPSNYEWAVHTEITTLWGELFAARQAFIAPVRSTPPAVALVLKAVEADPTRNWQAREMPELAGLSYSRLRHQFQQTQGETLHAFLLRTRLDRARCLLCDRRLAIREVAQQLNFTSEFYFSHFFRRGTGMSPSQFRKLL